MEREIAEMEELKDKNITCFDTSPKLVLHLELLSSTGLLLRENPRLIFHCCSCFSMHRDSAPQSNSATSFFLDLLLDTQMKATLPIPSPVAFRSVIKLTQVSKVTLQFPTLVVSPVKADTAQLNSWAAFCTAGASPGDSLKQQNCILHFSIT